MTASMLAFDDFMMHTDEELEEMVAPKRRSGDQKTGPIRLAGDADPDAEDFDREPEDTRDMLNLHLKRTNYTLDKNFERMENAVIRLSDALETQAKLHAEDSKRNAEVMLKMAERNAQAQVDVAAKASEASKYKSKIDGALVAALIIGLLGVAGLNISAKYADTEVTTSGGQ